MIFGSKTLREGEVREREVFAWLPTTLDCGRIAWFEKVLLTESYRLKTHYDETKSEWDSTAEDWTEEIWTRTYSEIMR